MTAHRRGPAARTALPSRSGSKSATIDVDVVVEGQVALPGPGAVGRAPGEQLAPCDRCSLSTSPCRLGCTSGARLLNRVSMPQHSPSGSLPRGCHGHRAEPPRSDLQCHHGRAAAAGGKRERRKQKGRDKRPEKRRSNDHRTDGHLSPPLAAELTRLQLDAVVSIPTNIHRPLSENIHRLPCPRGANPALETADPARADRPGRRAVCGSCPAGAALRAGGRSAEPGRSADPLTGQDAARTGDHAAGRRDTTMPASSSTASTTASTRSRSHSRSTRPTSARSFAGRARAACTSSPGPAGTATAATRRLPASSSISRGSQPCRSRPDRQSSAQAHGSGTSTTRSPRTGSRSRQAPARASGSAAMHSAAASAWPHAPGALPPTTSVPCRSSPPTASS